MYAIVEWGGKQYKVEEGTVLDLEKVPANEGDEVVFDKVLMYSDGDKIYVGSPYIPDVEVKVRVKEHRKGKKVIIFKYRRRHKYRLKKGHRQQLSKIEVTGIEKK